MREAARPRKVKSRASRPAGLLDLVLAVVARFDQHTLPVRTVHRHRLQQIGRYDLDAVVIGLGVVDFGFGALAASGAGAILTYSSATVLFAILAIIAVVGGGFSTYLLSRRDSKSD